VSTLVKKRESATQRESLQRRRDLQNTKHDINTPKYEIMIIEHNAVINTVTGTVTGQSGVKVQRSASTGWTLDRWDELLHESSQRRGQPIVQPEQWYTWHKAHDMRQL